MGVLPGPFPAALPLAYRPGAEKCHPPDKPGVGWLPSTAYNNAQGATRRRPAAAPGAPPQTGFRCDLAIHTASSLRCGARVHCTWRARASGPLWPTAPSCSRFKSASKSCFALGYVMCNIVAKLVSHRSFQSVSEINDYVLGAKRFPEK